MAKRFAIVLGVFLLIIGSIGCIGSWGGGGSVAHATEPVGPAARQIAKQLFGKSGADLVRAVNHTHLPPGFTQRGLAETLEGASVAVAARPSPNQLKQLAQRIARNEFTGVPAIDGAIKSAACQALETGIREGRLPNQYEIDQALGRYIGSKFTAQSIARRDAVVGLWNAILVDAPTVEGFPQLSVYMLKIAWCSVPRFG